MASSQQRISRDDWKKAKELEEARKAGTAPAELDEEGNEINPHIPQYIAQAPWYLDTRHPSLSHQRLKKTDAEGLGDNWYQRGAFTGVAIKFRKGACTNCGAMSHKAKECTERPRKIGAKFSNRNIKPDEMVQDVSLDYEGKHDPWNGYNAAEYTAIMEKYTKAEELKKRKKQERLNETLGKGKADAPDGAAGRDGDGSESDVDEDEGKIGEDYGVIDTHKDPRTRTTVPNLRIREDTAKYLRNLNVDSAYYDPKTRSMRENPNPSSDPNDAVYVGDNFIRNSGDTTRFAGLMSYAYSAYDKGQDINVNADPSKAELLYEEYKRRKEQLVAKQKETVLEKYGGEKHLKAPPPELIFAQTENYVEYSRDGQLLKGTEQAHASSKYPEDVLLANHTEVWGSCWEAGQWGFACCRQFMKNAYCTGSAGKEGNAGNAASVGSDTLGNADEISETPAKKQRIAESPQMTAV